MIKTVSKTSTGIVGVQGPYIRRRFRERKTCMSITTEVYFQATWQEQGHKRKATFAISVYGYDGAMEAARRARQRGVKGG